MHERERGGSTPTPHKAPPRDPAPEEITDRADGGPVKKSPHRVIELVIAYPEEIDVVRETDCEPMPRRRRGDFQESNPRVQDPIAEHHDVHVKCRGMSVLGRLTDRQRSEEHTSELQSHS